MLAEAECEMEMWGVRVKYGKAPSYYSLTADQLAVIRAATTRKHFLTMPDNHGEKYISVHAIVLTHQHKQ